MVCRLNNCTPHSHSAVCAPRTAGVSGPCPLEAHRFADTHYKTYARRCAELGIPPHPRTQKKDPGKGKRSARLVVYLEWLLADLLGWLF